MIKTATLSFKVSHTVAQTIAREIDKLNELLAEEDIFLYFANFSLTSMGAQRIIVFFTELRGSGWSGLIMVIIPDSIKP